MSELMSHPNHHSQGLKMIEEPQKVAQDEVPDSYREPRMFTIQQLKELFYLNINGSEVRTRLLSSEANIKDCE